MPTLDEAASIDACLRPHLDPGRARVDRGGGGPGRRRRIRRRHGRAGGATRRRAGGPQPRPHPGRGAERRHRRGPRRRADPGRRPQPDRDRLRRVLRRSPRAHGRRDGGRRTAPRRWRTGATGHGGRDAQPPRSGRRRVLPRGSERLGRHGLDGRIPHRHRARGRRIRRRPSRSTRTPSSRHASATAAACGSIRRSSPTTSPEAASRTWCASGRGTGCGEDATSAAHRRCSSPASLPCRCCSSACSAPLDDGCCRSTSSHSAPARWRRCAVTVSAPPCSWWSCR